MRKLFLTALMGGLALTSVAGTMTFTTNLEVGTEVRILLNAESATSPVSIDWGNGVEIKYTVDPSQMAYFRWIEGSIEGETIKISGNVTEVDMEELGLTSAHIEEMSLLTSLELQKNSIETFEIVGTTPLKTLNLSNNNLSNGVYNNPTLTLENAGETLSELTLNNNPNLYCLDARDLTALEYLTITDCENFGSIYICSPEESRESFKTINISNCDLAHFYPISMPNLRQLNLANNALSTSDDEPFTLGDYPSLTSLDLSDNSAIETLDVTGCTKLVTLKFSNDKLSSINVSKAPDLETLYADGNNISSFDFGNNSSLKNINVAGNPVKVLDVSKFQMLSTLDISNTNISRVMLMNAPYLTEFRASNTQLEFVDFNGQQASRVRIIDLRNNPNMTGETVDYTLYTLPVAVSTYNTDPNLLLEGSNAETADTSYATGSDLGWKCDVTGDGSATHSIVDVTLVDATDTGENCTGHLDRLYPLFGLGLDYDFDIYSTDGGKFLISQWQPVYFQTMSSVTENAYTGVPIHIYPYPEEGRKFKSVTVNGKDIYSQWFVIDGPAEIKVNFANEESSIALTSKPGQEISFMVNTATDNGTVWVDWGTGVRTEYTGQSEYQSGYSELSGTRIDGTTTSGSVTIYGDVVALDVSGYGQDADLFGLWDNSISAIDLSNSDGLKYLDAYWNPIESINLHGCPDLEYLNLSYTMLQNLDLTSVPSLMWLEAYSDGFGYEEDGISMLTSIDVTALPILQYLDVKNNELTSLDLSNNKYLRWLYANNNQISDIDLSANTQLEEVNLDENSLTALDLAALEGLTYLSVSNNNLTSLDVAPCTPLQKLYISNNDLHFIDTSNLKDLNTFYLNGNGMTADELNDIYYLLPVRQPVEADNESNSVSYNLAVKQGDDKVANAATRADSSIAVDRQWTPSHYGSNGGSDFAYLDILPDMEAEVAVVDADGNRYTHGSKVPKYTALTIEATSPEGYHMSGFSLNTDEPLSGTTFDMPGIYTKLHIYFAEGDGVESLKASDVRIRTVSGGVIIEGEATVDIFSLDGRTAVSATAVNGARMFNLPAGVYLVHTASATGRNTAKVLIF